MHRLGRDESNPGGPTQTPLVSGPNSSSVPPDINNNNNNINNNNSNKAPGTIQSGPSPVQAQATSEQLVQKVQLLVYATRRLNLDANPVASLSNYMRSLSEFAEWVGNAPELCRPCLEEIEFIVLCEMWSRMVSVSPPKATQLLIAFSPKHAIFHEAAISELKNTISLSAVKHSPFVSRLLRREKFSVLMDQASHRSLQSHLFSSQNSLVLELLQSRAVIDVVKFLPFDDETRFVATLSGSVSIPISGESVQSRPGSVVHPAAAGCCSLWDEHVEVVEETGDNDMFGGVLKYLKQKQQPILTKHLQNSAPPFGQILNQLLNSQLLRLDGEAPSGVMKGGSPARPEWSSDVTRSWKIFAAADKQVESLIRRTPVDSHTLPDIVCYSWKFTDPKCPNKNFGGPSNVTAVALERQRGSMLALADGDSDNIILSRILFDQWNKCADLYNDEIALPWLSAMIANMEHEDDADSLVVKLGSQKNGNVMVVPNMKKGDGSDLSESIFNSPNYSMSSMGSKIKQNTYSPSQTVLTYHSAPVTGISFLSSFLLGGSQNNLLSCSYDSNVVLWNISEHKPFAVYSAAAPLLCIDTDPKGYSFVTGSVDRTACLWRLDKNCPVRIFGRQGSDVEAVKFHPNGILVAAAGADGVIKIWDYRAPQCVAVIGQRASATRQISFSKNGRLLCASSDRSDLVTVWDIPENKIVMKAAVNPSSDPSDLVGSRRIHVTSTDFSAGSNLLAVSTSASIVQLWDTFAGSFHTVPVAEYMTKDIVPVEVAFTPENVLITVGLQRSDYDKEFI